MTLKRSDFPSDFLFGAATAAYQIEGHGFGGAGSTHWDTFAATPGNVVRAEDGKRACDHYHRYESDLDLLQAGGFKGYRFSTSWARVLPQGRGTPNQAGLDFYDRLVDAMLARDLEPHQTLYHWEMPSALADLGGWTNPDVGDWFADFAEIITRRIGDRVSSIATINEPWCVTYLSHFLGHHAPGKRDIRATARSMHHVLKAHGLALERLRGMGQKRLGIVLNFEDLMPETASAEDIATCATEDALYNRWFIQAITQGTYPSEALVGLEPHMPANWHEDMTVIHQPLDWLGVNYYTRNFVGHNPENPWPHSKSSKQDLPKTQMGWEIWPEGLHKILTRMARDYVGDLPIYVTENGMAWDDTVENGSVYDPVRSDFIERHLAAIHKAMNKSDDSANGANVRGFFYWSLLDNYEWAFGYEKRFGIIHVDFETLERTPKSSYHSLASWLRT